MLENQGKIKSFERNIFVLVDKRSTEDDTILLQYWEEDSDPPFSPLEYPDFGVLPPKYDVWYDYRIDFRGFRDMMVGLMFLPLEMRFPVYYGCKAELTDEKGVFDYARANRLCVGEDVTPEG